MKKAAFVFPLLGAHLASRHFERSPQARHLTRLSPRPHLNVHPPTLLLSHGGEAATAPSQAMGPILENVQVNLEGDKIVGSADLRGISPEQVKNLLTDYCRYPIHFKHEMEINKHGENGEVLIDHVIDTGVTDLTYTVKMEEYQTREGTEIIKWDLKESNLLAKLQGFWSISASDGGTHIRIENTSVVKNKWLLNLLVDPRKKMIKAQEENFKEIAEALSTNFGTSLPPKDHFFV